MHSSAICFDESVDPFSTTIICKSGESIYSITCFNVQNLNASKVNKGEIKNATKSKEKEKVMQLGMLVDQMGQSMEEEEEIEPGSES